MRFRFLLPMALGAAAPLRAQQLPRHLPTYSPTVEVREPAAPPQDTGRPAVAEQVVLGAVGAAMLGVAGFYGGALAGFTSTGGHKICGDDPCGFLGAFLGALLGEAVGIGLGAHLGTGGKGTAWAPVGASLGVLIAAGMVGRGLDLPGEAIVLVPVVQVAAAVWAAMQK